MTTEPERDRLLAALSDWAMDISLYGHKPPPGEAWIIIDDRGPERRFEWQGEEDGEVRMTTSLLAEEPGLLASMPWKLVMVRHEPWRDEAVYKRAEYVEAAL